MRVGLLKWLKIIGMYETISDIEGAEVYNEANANLKLYLTTENVGYYGAQFGPHSNYPGVGIYVRYSGILAGEVNGIFNTSSVDIY